MSAKSFDDGLGDAGLGDAGLGDAGLGDAGLGTGEVRLRLVDLDRPHWMRPDALAALSADERARARRFRSSLHRDRFLAGRTYVRLMIGCHLGLDPARLVLGSGEHGKPCLASGDGHRLSFNLAHSENVALLGLTTMGAVGVDLELVRPLGNRAAVQRTVFAEREIAGLDALPASRQLDAFFAAWVCKEAVVKLTGAGMSQDLRAFEVAADPGLPARLTHSRAPSISHETVELWRERTMDGGWAAAAVFRHATGPAPTFRLIDDRGPPDGN